MPKAVLPGPHDPFNAGSVRLAEATRIRLILPGLGNVEEEVDTKSRSSKSSSEAAAKTRKKLSKLRGIAQQAEQSQSAVVVDEDLLADEEDVEAEQQQQQQQKQRQQQEQEQQHQQQERLRSGMDSSTSKPATPGDATTEGRRRLARKSPSGSGEWSSRLGAPSDAAAGRMAAVKRIPIWERLSNASGPAPKEKLPTPQKTMTPIALKTFSPTLGSLATIGSLLPDSPSPKSPADAKGVAAAEAAYLAGAKFSVVAPSRRPLSPNSRSAKASPASGQLLTNGTAHLQSVNMQHSPGSAAALLEKLTFGGR